MNPHHTRNKYVLLVFLWMFAQLAFNLPSASASQPAALRVLAIEIDGKPAERAEGVALSASGESAPRKTALKTGDAIALGTDIVVPPRTVLVLETANGNQIRLQPGSGYRTGSVSGQGETHSMLFGKAFFRVKHALDFFNVNYDSFLAIVRGTEFSVEVAPKKEISFSLDKGKLLVQRDVKVRILEGNKVAELKASKVLQQGGKTTVSYRLGIDEYLKKFKTFREAEEYYRRKLEEDERSGDYDRIQGGLNAMGNILCTLGKNRDAIGYYNRALQSARDNRDVIWEANFINNLGVAYHNLGNNQKAIEFHEKALDMQLKLYSNSIHPDIAKSYICLGNAYLSPARNVFTWKFIGYRKMSTMRSQAIEYYYKSLSMLLKLYPNDLHPYIAKSYKNLSLAYEKTGEQARADEYAKKALDIENRLEGK